ncbi:MAG: DUF4908 domain-containing protein [Hyphomonadaceae bacterium]
MTGRSRGAGLAIAAGLIACVLACAPTAAAQQAPQQQTAQQQAGQADARASDAEAATGALNPYSPNGYAAQGGAFGSVRYTDSASRQSFVLDQSGQATLMKFENSPEVLVLRAAIGPRGDTFLRSESGQLVLRVTELGNVIAYIGDADGAPADMAAAAAPINAPDLQVSLEQRVADTRTDMHSITGREISVFGAGAFVREQPWAADALQVAVLGVRQAQKDKAFDPGAIEGVRLVRTQRPAVAFQNGELVIGLNPAMGYSGRPSSELIAKALAASAAG